MAKPNSQLKLVIIGAGISGVALGRLLQLSGETNFIILESEEVPGGLCRTQRVNEHWLDIGGGHFLHTKYPLVYDFIFSHIPKEEFNFFTRISRISIDSFEIDYPIESNIWQMPDDIKIEYLSSYIRNGEFRNLPHPKNFEEYIIWKFGSRISESFMLPYNQKIWGIKLQEMSIDWLDKIPQLSLDEVLTSCILNKELRDRFPSHQNFYYPKKGGFQQIFNAMANPLSDKIITKFPVQEINYNGCSLVVNGEYKSSMIINTSPWSKINFFPAPPTHIKNCIKKLRNNSIVISLHEKKRHQSAHWLYKPNLELQHHREFFIHNFAPHSQDNGVFFETNSNRYVASEDTIYSHLNEYAYPIPTIGKEAAVSELLAYMEEYGIFGLGRWGQWQYYNSDVCIWESMKLFQRLFGKLPQF